MISARYGLLSLTLPILLSPKPVASSNPSLSYHPMADDLDPTVTELIATAHMVSIFPAHPNPMKCGDPTAERMIYMSGVLDLAWSSCNFTSNQPIIPTRSCCNFTSSSTYLVFLILPCGQNSYACYLYTCVHLGTWFTSSFRLECFTNKSFIPVRSWCNFTSSFT